MSFQGFNLVSVKKHGIQHAIITLVDKVTKAGIQHAIITLLDKVTKAGIQHAIITLVDKVTKAVDSGDIVINMFIDLRKAFDTVSHSILLKKLHAYGIRGNMLKLCASYLDDRSQYVQYKHANSALRNVNCRVPQGSIIGSLFFIVFMNDIFTLLSYFLMFSMLMTLVYFYHIKTYRL